ncbi:MAG: hypothetical protein ACYC0W_13445, partial [Candidatus Nanopelagicales bacterium]
IIERVPLEIAPNDHNRAYLQAKVDRMGHTLEPEPAEPAEPADAADVADATEATGTVDAGGRA